MSLVKSAHVLVFSMLAAVDICNSKTLTCDQLPKLDVPSIETLVVNGPFRNDHVLTSFFECSTEVFTKPARGIMAYSGTALSVNRDEVLSFDYTVSSDKKTMEATLCSTGEKVIWHLSAAHFDKNGAFICIYTCKNNALEEFVCGSNNNGASPAELEAVNLAKQVPNGDLIHNAWKNCPESKGCNKL